MPGQVTEDAAAPACYLYCQRCQDESCELSSLQFHLLSKPGLHILFLTQCSCLIMDSYMFLTQALAGFSKSHVHSAFSPFSAGKLVQYS